MEITYTANLKNAIISAINPQANKIYVVETESISLDDRYFERTAWYIDWDENDDDKWVKAHIVESKTYNQLMNDARDADAAKIADWNIYSHGDFIRKAIIEKVHQYNDYDEFLAAGWFWSK